MLDAYQPMICPVCPQTINVLSLCSIVLFDPQTIRLLFPVQIIVFLDPHPINHAIDQVILLKYPHPINHNILLLVSIFSHHPTITEIAEALEMVLDNQAHIIDKLSEFKYVPVMSFPVIVFPLHHAMVLFVCIL